MTTAPWLFLWRLDIILTSLVVKVILFKIITKVKFWFLLYNRLPLYSFCIPFCTPFVFPLSKFSNLISIPFKVISLILLYSLCCPIHYIKLSQVFDPLITISLFLKDPALQHWTRPGHGDRGLEGKQHFQFFSFIPFCFLLLEGEHHYSIVNFFHVIFLFWWKTSSINLQFSFFIPSCFLFWWLANIIILSPFFFLLHILLPSGGHPLRHGSLSLVRILLFHRSR